MFSPASWEVIPNSRIEMDAHEHILCCRSVYLKSEASMSGRKQYIAIGTSNICGEDYQRTGSAILAHFRMCFSAPVVILITKKVIDVVIDRVNRAASLDQKGATCQVQSCVAWAHSLSGHSIITEIKIGEPFLKQRKTDSFGSDRCCSRAGKAAHSLQIQNGLRRVATRTSFGSRLARRRAHRGDRTESLYSRFSG